MDFINWLHYFYCILAALPYDVGCDRTDHVVTPQEEKYKLSEVSTNRV